MQITKYTLDKTHYTWGETIGGTVTIKMGSGETISASKKSFIAIRIDHLISVNGELQHWDDGEAKGWPYMPETYIDGVTLASGATQTFSFSITLPEADDEYSSVSSYKDKWESYAAEHNVDLTGADRIQPYIELVVVAEEYDSKTNIRKWYSAKQQIELDGGFLFSRLAPQISNLQIKDKFPGNQNGLIRRFLLGGQSKPVITCDVTLDPLDSTLTGTQKVEIIELYVDPENAVLAEASGDLGSELMPTLPMETGNESGIKSAICHLVVTDNLGASSSVDEYIQLYDYAGPPQLSVPVGYELAERYAAVETDEDGTEYVPTDDGLNVWLSFDAKISRIAPSATGIEGVDFGSNRWYLDISYGETGGEMTTIASAASDSVGPTSVSFERDKEFLEKVVFDPVKKYTISITVRDAVGNSATLTTYIDKAGGYLNIEKHGVAVGMRSTGTPKNPIFECNYPAFFYGGIFLSEEGKQELIKELLDAMSGCTYLNWIESSGTQYIDTGLKPTNLTGFDIDFITYNDFTSSSYGAVFGARQGSKAKEYQMSTFTMSSGGGGILRYGASEYDPKLKKGERISATLRNGVFSTNLYDGFTVAAQTFTSPVNLTVFALNNNGSVTQHGKVRIYSMKIYNGDLLIRDFVPAQRNADAAIGFYDHVTREFYENKGTGTFTYG